MKQAMHGAPTSWFTNFLRDERGDEEVVGALIMVGIVTIALITLGLTFGPMLGGTSAKAVAPTTTATVEVESALSDVRAATMYDAAAQSSLSTGTQTITIPVTTNAAGTSISATEQYTANNGVLDVAVTGKSIKVGAHINGPVVQAAPDFGLTTVVATPLP
jgi:Flp pilus assembly pilin Flp